jgi:hypothetical protein
MMSTSSKNIAATDYLIDRTKYVKTFIRTVLVGTAPSMFTAPKYLEEAYNRIDQEAFSEYAIYAEICRKSR